MEKEKIYFFTSSILNWIPILEDDTLKNILVDSLRFLVNEKVVNVYAFVIMPNHIHLILKPLDNPKYKNFQLSFMRFTGQKIKFYLQDYQPGLLEKFLVNKKDRIYQIWQRNPLSIELYSRSVFEQKLDYIHANPVQEKWKLVEDVVDYKYSSIRFYEMESNEWTFLSHYSDEI